MLQPLLEQYYYAEEGQEEGDRVYSRTKEQGSALLLTLLMTALIAEDYSMGGRQFEALRAALKLTPQDLVNLYRQAHVLIPDIRRAHVCKYACPECRKHASTHAQSTHPCICSRFGSDCYQGASGDMLAALSIELATLMVGSRDGILGLQGDGLLD